MGQSSKSKIFNIRKVRISRSKSASSRQPVPHSWPEIICKFYMKKLNAEPLATQVVTSGVMYAVADLISQKVGHKDYSFTRNILAAVWGTVLVGPTIHFWKQQLEYFISGHNEDSKIRKLLLNLAVGIPIGNLLNTAFFTFISSDSEWGVMIDRVRSQFIRAQLVASLAWASAELCRTQHLHKSFGALFHQVCMFICVIGALGSGEQHPACRVTFLDTTISNDMDHRDLEEWDYLRERSRYSAPYSPHDSRTRFARETRHNHNWAPNDFNHYINGRSFERYN